MGVILTNFSSWRQGIQPGWLDGLSLSSVEGGVLPCDDSAHPKVGEFIVLMMVFEVYCLSLLATEWDSNQEIIGA